MRGTRKKNLAEKYFYSLRARTRGKVDLLDLVPNPVYINIYILWRKKYIYYILIIVTGQDVSQIQ